MKAILWIGLSSVLAVVLFRLALENRQTPNQLAPAACCAVSPTAPNPPSAPVTPEELAAAEALVHDSAAEPTAGAERPAEAGTDSLDSPQPSPTHFQEPVVAPQAREDGSFVWAGNIRGSEIVTISGSRANTGHVSGLTPDAPYVVTSISPPGSARIIRGNHTLDRSQVNFLVHGFGPTQVTVNWARLSLH